MALTNNLVAYWKLDGNSNDSVASNNGTDTNITYNSSYGKINQGALFNNNSKIDINDDNSLDITSSITISFWIYLPSAGDIEDTIIYKGTESGTNSANYVVDLGSDGRTFRFVYYSTNFWWFTGQQLPLNSWTHVVFTYTFGSSSNAALYYNGSAVTLTPRTTWSGMPGISNTYKLSIGYRGYKDDRYLSGYLDEIGLWSRALSASEVSELYNSGNGLTYPFTIANTSSFFKLF